MIELIALYGAGVASFIAPCVLPLVPVYLGIVGAGATRGSARLVGATVCFVLGFATVFAAVGSVAGTIGSIDAITTGVRITTGAFIVALGAATLAGKVHVIVRPLARLAVAVPGHAAGSPVSATLVGAGLGAAWTPCVGPLLGLALGTAVVDGRPLWGATLLFSFGLGLGTPFVVTALAASGAPSFLALARRASHRIEPVMAIAMIVLGVLLVTDQYEPLIARLDGWLPARGTL